MISNHVSLTLETQSGFGYRHDAGPNSQPHRGVSAPIAVSEIAPSSGPLLEDHDVQISIGHPVAASLKYFNGNVVYLAWGIALYLH